jgi:hypothetical protein
MNVINEMYDLGIVAHNYGVISIFGVILLNVFILLRTKDINSYKKFMLLFTPIGSTALSVIIFTGIIMMATKHLEFTIENIVMIIFSIFLIYLEIKRSLDLKHLNQKDDISFLKHKSFALKIYALEMFVALLISIWMWI